MGTYVSYHEPQHGNSIRAVSHSSDNEGSIPDHLQDLLKRSSVFLNSDQNGALKIQIIGQVQDDFL